jgi:hypothetical protein
MANNAQLIDRLNIRGKELFLSPKPELSLDLLIRESLGANTYRGFHRIDKSSAGASVVFRRVLDAQSTEIISRLNQITTEPELDQFSQHLQDKLFPQLKKVIRGDQLKSFNKLRKPLDIVVEHFVGMGKDFRPARTKLISALFLPLDSQIFQSELIFPDRDMKSLSLKRTFSFSDVRTREHYAEVQAFLADRARQMGLEARIYFDLIWGNRYKRKGTNLFATNG